MKQIDVEKKEKEREEVSTKKAEEKKGSGYWPYFLGLGLGLALSFGVMYLIAGQELKEQPTKETNITEEAATSTLENEQTTKETESASEQSSETTTPAISETTKTTPQEEAQSSLDKTKITIQLLNGNGIKGDAVKVKTVLEKDGWKVATYGNANSFNYKNTLVYYKKGQEEAAKGVAETLKNDGRHTAILESSSLTKYDIQVILGKQ